MTAVKHRRLALVHPLAGSGWGRYVDRYREHAPYDARSRWSRTATSTAAAVQAGLATWERLTFDRRLRPDDVPRDPIFVIGHWRSGTTHLHNLLSQDPRFGWLSLGQALMPGNMLSLSARAIYGLLRRAVPRKRSFDNVPLGIDLPQEEEIALGNLSPLSYFNCYYYPGSFREEFHRSVLLSGASQAEVDALAGAYRLLLAKLARLHPGRRLLLKNPASTARVALLKQLFPEARFIHIVRDPLLVFSSSLRRLPAMLSAFAWQSYAHLDLEDVVVDSYRELMRRFLDQRAELAPGELVETRYEDLVTSPLSELERIYDALQIPDFPGAASAIQVYLDRTGTYAPNVHTPSAEQCRRIATDWDFAFDAWHYSPPGQ